MCDPGAGVSAASAMKIPYLVASLAPKQDGPILKYTTKRSFPGPPERVLRRTRR